MDSLLAGNSIYRNVYCFWGANPGNAAYCTPEGAAAIKDGILPGGMEWLAFTMAALSVILLVVNVFLAGAALFTYVERRLLGRFQGRLGPNRVGPFGVLQPIADGLKLLTKEDTMPEGTDRWVFNLAPMIMMGSGILVLAVLPFGKNSFIADLNIGILYVFAVTGVNTLAMFMAALATGNRYAMFGGMRAVAQLISYEIPVVLSVVGIILMTGTMSLVGIVEAQKVPFLIVQPLAFFIFLAGTSAEMNRSPFDQVEAEGEIIAGYHTEYSGMKFGMFQAAEFGAFLLTSALLATLVPQRVGRAAASFTPLVPYQSFLLCLRLRMVQGHAAQAARRSDHGLCLEVPVAAQLAEHLCGSSGSTGIRRRGCG